MEGMQCFSELQWWVCSGCGYAPPCLRLDVGSHFNITIMFFLIICILNHLRCYFSPPVLLCDHASGSRQRPCLQGKVPLSRPRGFAPSRGRDLDLVAARAANGVACAEQVRLAPGPHRVSQIQLLHSLPQRLQILQKTAKNCVKDWQAHLILW